MPENENKEIDIKALGENMLKGVEALKGLDAQRAEEIKKLGTEYGETKGQVTKISADIATMMKELQEAKAAMNRPPAAGAKEGGPSEADLKAYWSYLQTKQVPAGYEFKATEMNTISGPAGGFMVPKPIFREIIEIAQTMNPIAPLCDTIPLESGDSLDFLAETSDFDGAWANELDSRSQTNAAALKEYDIKLHDLYAYPWVTNKFLRDAGINALNYINTRMARALATKESTAFVTGTGIKQPYGLIVDSAVYANYVDSGSAGTTTVSANALIKLPTKVPAMYTQGQSKNCAYIMNSKTLQNVIALRADGTTGLFLFSALPNDPFAMRVAGFPVIIADSMPDEADGGVYPVLFGNFWYYKILRKQAGVLAFSDQITKPGWTKFFLTTNVGGRCVQPNAFAVVKTD